ncbi:hypothetical protein ETAA8_51580 [Anatilimnocola aggregata]|uniref:DUF1549 domain-containing protein n=1 Tax=Anatilimnocola aggregata TaxID=2528021 RepID=A0A517YII5_9BACT|nr:DUF1549 and DUF1553 domain-containing protein [Anatilimnocola aggregata]QDU30040.1 hypothetical protein ETAA8_51580 [Anatilimnocola aggregata]
MRAHVLACWCAVISAIISSHVASAAEKVDYDLLPWAFRPLARPVVPAVKDESWPRAELDRFILAGLEKQGIQPNADADRRTLLRRASFDLTGLPPTQQEIAEFVDDPASDDVAFAKAVDRYLRSQHFGERWGRHWLDIARYGDSTGRAWNAPFTYAWRYRDWVIDAFNDDLPYDRFLTEQLAGDLLPAKSAAQARSQLIATGFLAIGSHDLQNLSYEQFKFDVIDDQIDATTRAILGLSVSCARCHDHKYDPIKMHDYYALAGVFRSLQLRPGVTHQRENGSEGYLHPSRLVPLPGVDESIASRPSMISLPPGVHSMTDYQDEWRTGLRDIRFTTAPNVAMGVIAGEPRDCEILLRGEPYDLGEVVARGDWRITGLPPGPRVSANSGGRLELARWLTSNEQPLTSRVMANRVWQHLFGVGIVRTVDDFGINAEDPTNPELLDHLAWQFRSDGWSLKKLIRTIVLSRAYRLSSASQTIGQEKDGANALIWRMNLRRLEIEPLRDSLLEVAGRLDLDRPPGIQIAGVGGKSPQSQVRSLLPFSSSYRTVYLPVVRAKISDEFATFDFPDPCLLQGQREVTTVAPQALFFLNSSFVVDCSQDAADRMLGAVTTDAARVDWIYRRLFARPATAEEVRASIKLVTELEPGASVRDAELYRWSTLVQALFASAEFRYLK